MGTNRPYQNLGVGQIAGDEVGLHGQVVGDLRAQRRHVRGVGFGQVNQDVGVKVDQAVTL